MSGGELYAPVRTKAGDMTTELRALTYSDLHPKLFRLLHSKTKLSLPFRAITEAELSFDDRVVFDREEEEDNEVHPLLGCKEVQIDKTGGGGGGGSVGPLHANLGCFIDYIQKLRGGIVQPAEGWLLRDVKGFEDWRFELVEYQRRPFVRHILTLLGFVEPDDSLHGLVPHALRQMQYTGLLQNVSQSMQALTKLISIPDPEPPQPSASEIAAEEKAEDGDVGATEVAAPETETANGTDEYESEMEIEIDEDDDNPDDYNDCATGNGVEDEMRKSGSGDAVTGEVKR